LGLKCGGVSVRITKTIKDIQWAFISLAVSSLVHFLLRVVLGRELGASGLGIYTLVFVIYLLGMQFAAFGLGAALTKYIAEHIGNLKKIKAFVSSGLIGSLLSGLAIGIFLFVFSGVIANNFFHIPEMEDLLKITAFCFPFIAMQKVVIGTLNGLRKMKYFAFVNIVQNVSVFVLSFVLVIFLKKGVNGAVIGLVIPTILVSLFSLVFIKDFFERPSKLFNTVLKTLSWFGIFVVLINSIGLINTQIDSILIGHFMTEADVGYYAIAVILIQGITLLPHAIHRVTTPTIAMYHGRNDNENIKKLIKEAVFKTFLITVSLIVALAIFGKLIISILFTTEFLPAYTPLLILLVGYTIYAPLISAGAVLSSIGKINISLRVAVLNVTINTILNIILIPKFGIVGAATATSSSLIMLVVINLILYRRYVFKREPAHG
jgi:O-antigen/teichoic acid export membrane protein